VSSGLCFATFEGFDGCVQSCRHAAAVLGGTSALVTSEGETPAAVLQADVLILSSWHERYEDILVQRDGPVVVRWHSTVLQTELGHEEAKIARVLDLLDGGIVRALAVSDREFASTLGRQAVVFVPEVLAEGEYEGVVPAPLRGVHISLFGAGHARKNILVQSAAFDRARQAGGPTVWTLHLNGQTYDDRRYDQWLTAARIPYVDHGWMDRPQYLSLVSAMDAGLCATLAESYSYVAADHVALGVPVVVSPAIACLGDAVARVRPERVEEVAAGLLHAISRRADVAEEQRRSLMAQARVNREVAQAALSRIVSLTAGDR
jgi:hypothetical protein